MTPNLFSVSTTPMFCQSGTTFSPLVLADRLITLAQEADRAGLTSSASRLIGLVYAVLDDDSSADAVAA